MTAADPAGEPGPFPLTSLHEEDQMRLIYIANRRQQYDSSVGATDPDPGPTIIAESRAHVSILFGFLTLAFAAALARGVTGAQSGPGRVAVAIFCGMLLGGFIAGWIVTLRRPTR